MTNLYQLKNITFNYGANFNLADVCIDIEESNIIAIVGPNGSGKTSLLNILSFLNFPHAGSLFYNGIELTSNNFSQFRKTAGYVQQSPYLLRGTVFKNIELGLKLNKVDKETRVKKVLEVMRLLGINKFSNRNARTLSGGEAQKVAIGQVLVLDPDVLILDEPFTHLDKDAIDELEQIVLKLKEDLHKTIILTTHNQYQAQWLADHVYSVIKGKVFEYQMINLFSGAIDFKKNVFNTGKHLIVIPEDINHAEHIAIDPKQIVISRDKLDSSMQNSLQGKITGMTEDSGQVKVNIDANEEFQAVVTHKAIEELGLTIGAEVWISFKSSSILVF
tara:strand:+ start:13454 stop:14449 length:996 start_codon:yes stop_codon:yes gene_type:complete